jgi:hypothetical protein
VLLVRAHGAYVRVPSSDPYAGKFGDDEVEIALGGAKRGSTGWRWHWVVTEYSVCAHTGNVDNGHIKQNEKES